MIVKKMYAALIIVIVSSAMSSGACSRGYESQKHAGDLEIILRSSRYPISIGRNKFSVEVKDSAKNPVTDALVQAKYSLSPMPGNSASEFRIDAVPKGKGYIFAAEIPGAGDWKVEITVSQPGKPALSALFNLDAR